MFVFQIVTEFLKIRVPLSQLSIDQVFFGMVALIWIAAQVVADLIQQRVIGRLPVRNLAPQFVHEPQQPGHADVFLAQYLNGMCHAPILPPAASQLLWGRFL